MMSEDEFDIVAAFGGIARGERFAIYVPNKDQAGNSMDQKPWVDEFVRLLSEIGGGATAMPPVTGAWLNPETNRLVIEEPIIVYSYVYPDVLIERIGDLVELVRRMGRETNQGAVGLEYGGTFFTVEHFD
jgi:hypothetical protein